MAARSYNLNDTIRTFITVHNPSGGALTSADESPKFFVFENDGDTPIITASFTERSSIPGSYRGSFVSSIANGFNANNEYVVEASGKVDGIVGRAVIDHFVIDDIYNANMVQISGANLPGAFVDSNVIEISSDATAAQNLELQYDTTGLTGDTFPARQDTITTPSGVANAVWEESTVGHTVDGTFGGSLQPVYYANIKYIKDVANATDEYAACWYKNSIPVESGSLTNPAISVYNTNSGANLFINQTMNYASIALGVVRYDSVLLTPSGEPFVVHVSGVIDSATRTWKQIVGLDDIF